MWVFLRKIYFTSAQGFDNNQQYQLIKANVFDKHQTIIASNQID